MQRTYAVGMSLSDANKRNDAIWIEIKSLKWLFALKYDGNGNLTRLKAQPVASVSTSIGLGNTTAHSPVASHNTIPNSRMTNTRTIEVVTNYVVRDHSSTTINDDDQASVSVVVNVDDFLARSKSSDQVKFFTIGRFGQVDVDPVCNAHVVSEDLALNKTDVCRDVYPSMVRRPASGDASKRCDPFT
ncbi:uncharacterized protein PHALS_13455 [Plasmopara halstedii]|uniref:Uncharacterized protein n=1 Tax=Plasmopara halstedii TaxID=4781 RepID=A0A0P1AP63_PLAHL|nr:uncharacterized protein PHALS_13455 [Plasmopara halstedii]CEG43245.1 hypothetical protein PHALS_13455 [Plasmopara halstedii]|eukprot:XP_024579614.1 hypothetical protein PHALS_13455 [Plasmopara halstedii]